MSKEMHHIDDDPQPRKSRFSFDSPASESEPERVRREASIDSDDAMAEERNYERLQQEATMPESHYRGQNSRREAVIEGSAHSHPGQGITKLFMQVISSVIGVGFVTATLFSLWMPGSLMPGNLQNRLAQAANPSQAEVLTPKPETAMLPSGFPAKKIGIVVGHRGSDSGAVCSNGLTELEVNSNIATFAQMKLIDMGYDVELLDEFDPRLKDYQAGLLFSIHADSCDYINDSATGFKVAAALSETKSENSTRLVQCVADRYANLTGLRYHYQSVTNDMTRYHAFSEIDPNTTAGIIEVGFLNLDQEILTSNPELLADGIVAGIKCYMNNEGVSDPGVQP
jgi:N-acetylmuramoyl-L-alanine amidase